MKRMALKPMTFMLSMSRRRRSGSCGKLNADGIVVAGVAAPQVDPAAVEAEVAVREAEIAEAAARRPLVERVAPVDCDSGRHAVEIRIVQVPEVRIVDRQVRPRSCDAPAGNSRGRCRRGRGLSAARPRRP